MAKKVQKAKKDKQIVKVQSLHIESKVDQLTDQLTTRNYEGAIETGKILLDTLPQNSTYRVGVIINMGLAHMQLRHFKIAYKVFTEALALRPDDPFLLYEHALAARYTTRYGQALLDLERAAELGVSIEIERQFKKELKVARKLAEEALKMGGNGFTMEQLLEQENMNQDAIQLFAEGKYVEAEIAFKKVIEIADCLPQAHNNLSMCYLAQKRFDEGEAELRRALAMKPNYWLARRNLRMLSRTRRTGGEADWVSYGTPGGSRKQVPNKFIEN